jgi:hypothetical protein
MHKCIRHFFFFLITVEMCLIDHTYPIAMSSAHNVLQFVFSLLNDRISTTSTIVSNFLHSNVIKISSDFISRWTLCLLKSLGQFLRFHWKSLCYDCFWKLSWVPYMWTSPNRVICYHMGESWSKSINLGNLRWKVKVIQTCFIF